MSKNILTKDGYKPAEDLRAYVADYLKEEIAAEALTQNIPSFSEFLKSGKVHDGDLRSMKVFMEDGPVKRTVVVSMENEPRKVAGRIEILPWRHFLEELWSGGIIS